jgi:hypothetical protein
VVAGCATGTAPRYQRLTRREGGGVLARNDEAAGMRAVVGVVSGAAAAAALALVGPSAVAQAPGASWGPEVRLATSVDDAEPVFAAMSMDDDAVVGWTRRTTSGRSVRARLRTGPRGAWSAPVALGSGRLVALAMDLDGDALALRRTGSGPARAARILRNGDVIGSELPATGAGRVLGATLRQDGRAAAYVLRPGGAIVRLLVQESPGGAWARSGPDFTIPAPPTGLTASVNRAGAAVIAWIAPGGTVIGAATRYSIGSQWRSLAGGLPSLVPVGPSVFRPRAVMGDGTAAAVTWTASGVTLADPDRGAGAFIRTGPGPTAEAAALPTFGEVTGVAVSRLGTAMTAWTDAPIEGDLFASRFAPVDADWPIGIRRLAGANALEEGAFALTPAGSRLGPVILEASLETGPGPDGHVAFARDSRGAPWGAPRRLSFSRATPSVVAGERAALIALAVDDTAELVVRPYHRPPGGRP